MRKEAMVFELVVRQPVSMELWCFARNSSGEIVTWNSTVA